MPKRNPWVHPQLILPLMSGLFPLIIGVYLLRGGEFFHRLMMLGMGANQKQLNPHRPFKDGLEVEAVELWLKENPSAQERAKVDQIAMFRESRKSF